MDKQTRISHPRSLTTRCFLRGGLASALVLVVIWSLVLAGCGQATSPTASPKASSAPSSAPAASSPASSSQPSASAKAAATNTPNAQARTAALYEAAKKEGKVLWYSSAVADWGKALIDEFKKKYPGIEVEHFRANNEEIRERAITEAKAGKLEADVIEGSTVDHFFYLKEGLFKKHDWPNAASFRPEFKDPNGYWLGTRWVPQVIAYNTKLVSAAEAPKTWEDLLDPKWAGKLGIEEDDSTWMAAILQYMGEQKGMDYLRKLAAQKPMMRKGHSTATNLLAAGEFPVLIVTYPNLVEGPKAKGAPVEWVRVNPTLSSGAQGVGINKSAPHPNAAALWAEWLTSGDGGQAVHAAIGNPPANNDVANAGAAVKEQMALKVVSLSLEWSPKAEEAFKQYQELFWPK